MAKGFDTLKVKKGIKAHNKFDLSFSHLTTMNFGQIVPLLCEETVPGDKFNVKANYFSRMAPLVKPTYGKFSFNTVASFVPYYQVSEGIDAFMAGKTVWEGHGVGSRFITYQTLVNFADSVSTSVLGGAVATGASYDYSFINANGNRLYRRFTQVGKYYMKIMNALGYQLPESVDITSGGTWLSTVGTKNLSALPLLAFFKAYNDWMSQSQRYNTSQLTSILNDIKRDVTIAGGYYYQSSHQLSSACIKAMFDLLFLQYENGYFTSAWQAPTCPITGDLSTTLVYVDVPGTPGLTTDEVYHGREDTTLDIDIEEGAGAVASIGQRSLDFLKSFDDWVRRNNYSGSRVVQQIYSRFGIKTEDYKSNYAHIITTNKQGIQVGDVTSTSDTTGATLGDYAGKGIMAGNDGFSYQANDYGMLFVFGYYTVLPMYAFGSDRHCLRTQPLDYYNPEFDGIGAEAISYGEIFENPRIASGDTYNSNTVYGFTERYNSYRYGRDKITGEFRTLASSVSGVSAATDWNVWHTGRDLTAVRANGEMVAQSVSMNSLAPTDSEYNRIFSITDGEEDKFYLTCQFNVSAVRPMLSLNQVPRLGEGDTIVARNGNVIN